MSDLVLHGNDTFTSPYVFSAFVALTEKGLPFSLETLSLDAKEHHRAGYRDASVTGRVPALRHGDFWLAESSAIGEYLEEAFPPPAFPRLFPADVRERATVRMVQALVRSDFLPLRRERPTDTFFQGKPTTPLSAEGQETAERFLRIAAALVKDPAQPLVSQFTLADVDLSLMLMRLVANGDPVPAPLAAWARQTWTRPSIRAWLAKTTWRD